MITSLTNLFFVFLFMTNSLFGESLHVKLSDKIYNAYNKELKKHKNLFLVGSGGGMMDDVKSVSASYVSFEKLDVNNARKLYVEVVEGYLYRYNQDEKIRPYLHNYPFTINNLNVDICFKNENRRYVNDCAVAFMFVGRDQRLVYRAYDAQTDEFIPLYEEPYETARQIVMQEAQGDASAGSRSAESP